MTQDTLKALIHEHFGELDAPRVERTRAYHLLDIIAITLIAVFSGAEGWIAIETAKAKHEWLSRFLELPNGIPSHDTFGRVLARIDPQTLEQRFPRWVERLVSSLGG